MKISYQYIKKTFEDFLNRNIDQVYDDTDVHQLLLSCAEINKRLWHLEDVSRMHDLGFENVAKAKMEIDLVNQERNEIINQLDWLLDKHLGNHPSLSSDKFHSESPGLLIDRMAILFLRYHIISELVTLIEDKELKEEYLEKGGQLSENLNDLGTFLDAFFDKISKGEAFFKIYKPLKIYNDQRVKQYINLLTKERKHV